VCEVWRRSVVKWKSLSTNNNKNNVRSAWRTVSWSENMYVYVMMQIQQRLASVERWVSMTISFCLVWTPSWKWCMPWRFYKPVTIVRQYDVVAQHLTPTHFDSLSSTAVVEASVTCPSYAELTSKQSPLHVTVQPPTAARCTRTIYRISAERYIIITVVIIIYYNE